MCILFSKKNVRSFIIFFLRPYWGNCCKGSNQCTHFSHHTPSCNLDPSKIPFFHNKTGFTDIYIIILIIALKQRLCGLNEAVIKNIFNQCVEQNFCLFVWVEALRPSQQFFSHVWTEPPLPGYYQYFFGR